MLSAVDRWIESISELGGEKTASLSHYTMKLLLVWGLPSSHAGLHKSCVDHAIARHCGGATTVGVDPP